MAKKYIEVCPEIYQVGGGGLSNPEDCCIYLLNGGDESVLIDTGTGKSIPRILDNITAIGLGLKSIKYIVATHGHIDHIGGLSDLKKQLPAQIIAHQLELPAIAEGLPHLTAASWYGVNYKKVAVDWILTEEHTSIKAGNLELHCLHTPGHTPGGISIYVDHGDQRILFGQDIHGPFNQAWGSDMQAWRKSMQLLIDLEADILCEGHFGIYRPAAKVRSFIASHLASQTGR